MAWLDLQHFDKALADADASLACCDTHVESFLTKARALTGLQHYAAASDVLKDAMELSSNSAAIRKEYEDSCIRKEQSETGVFDLLPDRTDYPRADFVGPVELKKSTLDSQGIGLFVTRAVKRGEVLLVSNHSHGNFGKDRGDKITYLARACYESSRTRWKTHSLGNRKLELDPFRPNSLIEAAETIDLSLVHRVSCNYADCTLPFSINHSCTPNIRWYENGGAIFVLASRDMEAGEELVKSYFNSTMRLGVCLSIGFRCERCLLQSRAPLDGIAERYLDEDQAGNGINIKLAKYVAELEREMEKMGATKDEKMKMRCAFFRGYATYYARSSKEAKLPEMPEPVEVFEALHKFASGDGNTLCAMFGLHSMIQSELSPSDEKRVMELMMEQSVASAGSASKRVFGGLSAIRDYCEKLCLSGIPASPS